MNNKQTPIIILLTITVLLCACKKLVEAPPPTDKVSEKTVFTTDATAISAVTDIYAQLNSFEGAFEGYKSISIYTGLSSDELSLTSTGTGGAHERYYTNTLSASPAFGYELWKPIYNSVYSCNAAIAGLEASTTLTPAVKKQLSGEALLLRSFFYFYLTNLFGDVPLVLTTDAEKNALLARSPRADVLQQIITDLLEAETKLSTTFLNNTLSATSTERVRPTQWAAKALLARLYLYTAKYAQAEAKATEVINHNALFNLPATINQVFGKNSGEAIWQLQPTMEGFNTLDAYVMIIPFYGPDFVNPVILSPQLLNSFEAGDLRKKPGNWTDTMRVGPDFYQYAYKYKRGDYDPNISGAAATFFMTEYFMVLRLGEQYLIRAEARAQQNTLSGAVADIDVIRNRAGIPLIATTNPGISQAALLTAILHERQVELFTELGQRWFDLRRTGKLDAVMTVVTLQKSGGAEQWKPFQQYYPVSPSEIQRAPNLSQTTGY